MQFPVMKISLRKAATWATLVSALLLAGSIVGCGGSVLSMDQPASQPVPPLYLSPFVQGFSGLGSNIPQTYTFDHGLDNFYQTTYALNTEQRGPHVINAGTFTTSGRGLLDLEETINYSFTNNVTVTVFDPPLPGFAVELADQTGGLVQLPGQPVMPLAPAVACPSNTTTQTYQFLTIPEWLNSPATSAPGQISWNPATETAYGSVDVTASGSMVNFANIKQSTFPGAPGGTGTPTKFPLPSPSIVGACGLTQYGHTTIIPAQTVITNPLPQPVENAPPVAIIGIGPSGMLVEDNGLTQFGTSAGRYQNTLGAGTGAVGLPKPTSPLDIATLTGKQYQGFVYGSGIYVNPQPAVGWSSHLVSFGFPSAPTNCSPGLPVPNPSSTTLIYGGDFTNDTPPASGFGNCDLAIDLGMPTDNGLYPNATVWMGGNYVANTLAVTRSFPAVAIAGQLQLPGQTQSKLAIFLLGVDSTSAQSWAIYLLPSN